MGRPSPVKGKNLGHRDYLRCCLALDIMSKPQLSSEVIQKRYYQDIEPGSFHKTFKRDRDEFEREGLFLTEQKQGPLKIWSIDKERSLADTKDITQTERGILGTLLQACLTSPDTTEVNALGASIARIGQSTCSGLQQLPTQNLLCKKETLSRVAQALSLAKPITVDYQSLADNKPQSRTLQPWGIFVLGQSVYVVGLRSKTGQNDAIRTLNLERISHVEILKEEPEFTIPADFHVADYRLMPFEIGDEPQQDARFFVDASALSEFKAAIRKRGSLETLDNGNAIWTCPLRDTAEALRWALEAGVIPLAPDALTSVWKHANEEATHAK